MSRIKVGSALGIGIYLHWSIVLLPALVIFTIYKQGGGWIDMGFNLLLLAAILCCVVLHELGHAAMALYYGIPTRDITLYPIGGIARLERMSERPWHEFFIALAGPAVNVVLAALFFLPVAGLALSQGEATFLHDPLGVGRFLVSMVFMNVILVAFNLLPAFPMDGGRVLRALLALRLGRLRATEIAATVGLVIAAVMFVGGVYLVFDSREPGMLPIVGLFIAFVGQLELASVRHRERLRSGEPIDVLPADASDVIDVLPADPEPGFSGLAWDVHRHVWVVWQDGRPIAHIGSKSE